MGAFALLTATSLKAFRSIAGGAPEFQLSPSAGGWDHDYDLVADERINEPSIFMIAAGAEVMAPTPKVELPPDE